MLPGETVFRGEKLRTRSSVIGGEPDRGSDVIDRQHITARIREFIEKEFPAQDRELAEDTDLLRDWFVDSFGVIETVMFLESEFGIQVSRADINGPNFQTLGALTEFVAHRLAR